MNILVMGMGFVGITTALAFAESGWKITGLDPNQTKISSLITGKLPFYEPGLGKLLNKHISKGTISFTTEPKAAIENSQIIFICVGTPSNSDGSTNIEYVKKAVAWIGEYMDDHKWVTIKSTVPVGTHEKVVQWIRETQTTATTFDVISNPEFLREGSALLDTLNPDRVVIGGVNEESTQLISSLYANLSCPIVITSPGTAEMIKYASNAFLATKISFMNELARLCDLLEINISDVAKGMGLDHRIGPHFLQAGIGYGGSCFPKDVDSLIHMGKEHHTNLTLLEKVVEINHTQSDYFLSKLEHHLSGFRDKTIALLGISFKPNTDDTREAPSLKIISSLLQKQAIVQAHDPIAKLPASLLSDRLIQCTTMEDALHNADAAILCTEWGVYCNADWSSLKSIMKNSYVLDGRNALNGKQLTASGYHYLSVSNH